MNRYSKICTAITIKGTRCKKNKLENNEYCTIHNKMTIPTDVCSICTETTNWVNQQVLSKCNHKFCKSCINEWLCNEDTCPNCRTVIGKPDELIFNNYAIKNKKFVYINLTKVYFDNVTDDEYYLFMEYFNIFFRNNYTYQFNDMIILDDYLKIFPDVEAIYKKARKTTDYLRCKKGDVKKEYGVEVSDRQLQLGNNLLHFSLIQFKE